MIQDRFGTIDLHQTASVAIAHFGMTHHFTVIIESVHEPPDRVQQVAQQTGLSNDTLRYYERIGLLEPVGRAKNGHRRYTQHDIAWIDVLIHLRDTGMPLAQMVRFAELRRQGFATATERRIMLEEHQHSLEQRMQELEQHMAALQQKIARIKEIEALRDAASRSQ